MAKTKHQLPEHIADWTAQYVKRQRRLSWMGCAGCLVAALPVFFITFWVIYAVLWIGFQGLLATHVARLIGSGFVVLLLIPAYVTANWDELRNTKFESSDRLAAARLMARAAGSSGLALLAGPQTAHSFVKVLSLTLLLGPGLIHVAFRLAGRASLLDRLNVAAVSQSLACILDRQERVSLDELCEITHADSDQLAVELSLIDGVVPLKSGEPGFTLNDDLRNELHEHRISAATD